MKYHTFVAIVTIVAFYESVSAQTTVNPDISLIGDFQASIVDSGNFKVDSQGLEFAASGYLNPFARADFFLGIHSSEGTFEIEEASITLLRGLPLALQLKAGKFLVDFGKINTQHPHQWSWINRPLMHKEMFGGDGLRGVGFNLSGLYPVGEAAFGLSVNILSGKLLGHHHNENEHTSDVSDSSEAAPDLSFATRALIFTPFGTATFLETGLSFLRAEYDPDKSRFAHWANLDFKLKWKPDSYRSLTLIAELLNNWRVVDDTSRVEGERKVNS